MDMYVSVWLSEGWLYYWWKAYIDHITTDLIEEGYVIQCKSVFYGDPFKSVMNIVGETRCGAVVVMSKNKAGRTALYSFYFIYVPRSVWVPRWGSIFQVGSDDGLVCCFLDVLVAHIWRFLLHTFNRLVAFFFLAFSSVCLLYESLLSRTTPRYLSDCTSSRCVKAGVGGSVINISATALCISGGTVMVE